MKKFTIILLITLISISACQEILFEDLSSNDPQKNLDYLWNQANLKYSFFDVKGIDWDAIHDEYSGYLFDGISDDSLFRVLGGMITELRDDHTNLESPLNISFYSVRSRHDDNYDDRIVKDNYLPRDFYVSGPFTHDYLLGTNEEIGYIRFPAFTGIVDEENLDFILDRYANTRGLILDLRENGGGATTDWHHIMERFVDEKTTLMYSRIKNGPGPDDFTDPEPVEVEPTGTLYVDKPVMFLVDRGTYSAGSFTSTSTKPLPNVMLVGDTTGGGLGIPNGGQLPNGWMYRFSVSQGFTEAQKDMLESGNIAEFNATNYENGVPCDICVSLDRTTLDTDEILDRAIQEINTINP